MANENQLDILIRTIADTHGAQAIQDSFKRVTSESQRTNTEFVRGAEKSSIKTTEWKQSLRLLGSEFGIVGRIASFALNPIVAVTAGATIAIGTFKRAVEASNKALDEINSGSSAEKQIEAIKDAFIEATKEAGNFRRELEAARAGDSPANREIQRMESLLRSRDQAQDKDLDARKSAALEGATPEARTRIQKEFAAEEARIAQERLRRDTELKTVAAEMLDIESKTFEQRARSLELSLQSATADVGRRKAQLEADQEEKKKLDTFIEEAERKGGFWGPMGTFINTDSGYFQGLKQRQSGLSNQIGANASAVSYAELYGIPELSGQLSGARGAAVRAGGAATQFGAQAANATEAQNRFGPGAMLLSAAEGADAIMGGGRASGAQAAAINAAQKALGLSNQQADTVIRILSALNDRQEYLERALKQMEARAGDQRR